MHHIVKSLVSTLLIIVLSGCSFQAPAPSEPMGVKKNLPATPPATVEPAAPLDVPTDDTTDEIMPFSDVAGDSAVSTETPATRSATGESGSEPEQANVGLSEPVPEPSEMMVAEGQDTDEAQPAATQEAPVPFFVGNSLMEGMRLNSEDGYTFQCKVGISLPTLNQQLNLPDNYTMAVIEMGSNELGAYSEQRFKEEYIKLINTLNCPCYCLSIPPCNEAKSQYADRICNANVRLYNSYIQDVCTETGATYVDCSEFFGDVLPAEWTGDGLHLSSSVYANWYQWVLSKVGLK